MCRMILSIGNVDMGYLVDGLHRMADGNNVKYSWHDQGIVVTHHHAWGAALHFDGKWHVRRVPKELNKEFDKLVRFNPDMAILHARHATVGGLQYDNVHPFHDKKEEHIFCHNGTVLGAYPPLGKFLPKGNTDSEKLFGAIMNKMEEIDMPQAAMDVIAQLEDCWATNVFFATPGRMWVISHYTKTPRSYLLEEANEVHEIVVEPRYYSMQLSVSEDAIIVSSEPLPGKEWKAIPNDVILEINPETLEIITHKL